MAIDETLFGNDLFGEPVTPEFSGMVAERFLASPFSVLDTRNGEWQKRKKAWKSIGIKSEVGRAGYLTFKSKAQFFDHYRVIEGNCKSTDAQGTSIFDPFLTELMYKWFCPAQGQIIDPFAGGSVRGIVAALLGNKYWGSDLNKLQIEENWKQAQEIAPEKITDISWVWGNSFNSIEDAPEADFILSCPPYGDLEVYSDDADDLSNMPHNDFLDLYYKIIYKTVSKLKENRFACFVVADFRDTKGYYRNFVSETISAFEQAGAKLYNEAILVNMVGTASLRVTRQFNAGRKLCKTHQNVLVFCKGDWRKATERLKDAVVPSPDLHCDTGRFDQQFTDETGSPEAEELEKEESLTESPIMQELGILEKEESNLNKVNNIALF